MVLEIGHNNRGYKKPRSAKRTPRRV